LETEKWFAVFEGNKNLRFPMTVHDSCLKLDVYFVNTQEYQIFSPYHRDKFNNLKAMNATKLALVFVLLCPNLFGQNADFNNPPPSARPGAYWCWLNGNMTTRAITYDLEEMKAKGMNRAEIWDVAAVQNAQMIPAGGPFLGDQSVVLIKHALSEGRRLNMKIGLIASSGWNAGGSWVSPEWASKALYFSETQAEGAKKLTIDLPFPKVHKNCPVDAQKKPLFYKEVAVLAIPHREDKTIKDLSQVIDLTTKFSNGELVWDAPPGKWTIIRFICSNTGQSLIVPSPQSNGLFIDFFDPEATKRHLKYFMDRLGITPENSAEKGLAYLEFDSMELEHGVPWTDEMPKIFKERQGYDIKKYMTVLAGWKLSDQTDRFNYDFKKTISDQLIFSHYTTGTEFLKKYNAELVAESGGPGPPIWGTCPVDALKALGNVSVPRGEFWIKHRNMFLIKEVASAAHIYGKKLVDAESFTTWRRWKDSPFEMKKYVDRAFCEGLNNITFHTFASTTPEDGFPGRGYHAGSDINTTTTWWEKSKPFMDYLSRCSYVLQQGLFVADVCYYYGDQAPNFFPLFHSVPEKPMIKGLSVGYDYDVINSDVILNRMSVKNGRIVLPDGMSYALMVLPEQKHMTLEVLKKLEKMVKEGAILVGPKPSATPGLGNFEKEKFELNRLADKLWGKTEFEALSGKGYGQGAIYSGISPEDVLKKRNIEKDFIFEATAKLDYIHRSTADGEVYFIRNESENWVRGEASFRVSGKYPEIWDPGTGMQYAVSNLVSTDQRTSLPLELPPHGSVFIVFNDKKQEGLKLLSATAADPLEKDISRKWDLSFPEGWGAPKNIVIDQLKSWTEFEQKGIKYFSGTATYQKKVNISNHTLDKTVTLDLGEVKDVAEVFINGKSAGVLWKKPYQLDITYLLKNGENDLKVEIVNQWVNRLTGDMLSDPKDRYCKTNVAYVKNDGGGGEGFKVQDSGLLGPVKLISSK